VSVAYSRREVTRRFQFAAIGPTGTPLFGVVDAVAMSHPSGLAFDGWAEHRQNYAMKTWDLQPSFALRAASYGLGDWAEGGAGALSLSGESHSVLSVQGDAGLRISRTVGRVLPFVSGAYRRELASRHTDLRLQIGTDASGAFDVEGLELSRDKIMGQTGVTFVPKKAGLSVYYEIQGSRGQVWQSLQLGVRF